MTWAQPRLHGGWWKAASVVLFAGWPGCVCVCKERAGRVWVTFQILTFLNGLGKWWNISLFAHCKPWQWQQTMFSGHLRGFSPGSVRGWTCLSALYTLQTNLIFQGLHLEVFLFFFFPQDPLDPAGTAIVISSLVPGGVAERGGQILPGDRLVFVNEKHLDGATLTEAVEVLKSVPPGTVSLGICKPLVVRTDFNYFFSLISSHGVRRCELLCLWGEFSVNLGNNWAAVPWEGQKFWQMGSSVSKRSAWKTSTLKFFLQEHPRGTGRCAWADPRALCVTWFQHFSNPVKRVLEPISLWDTAECLLELLWHQRNLLCLKSRL